MNLFSYTIESNLRSLQPITHFKIHKHRSGVKHLVWWKLSLMWSQTLYCEECEAETGLESLCQDCFEHHFCECGTRLEDSWGQPGDGMCVRCR